MTPKSLLRHPLVISPVAEFTSGFFKEVIDENREAGGVRRLLFCSGKIYYDLIASRKESGHVALVRIEQFYPYPEKQIAEILEGYSQAVEIVWTQEEPLNMGGWTFMQPRLGGQVRPGQQFRAIGRTPAASPASGSLKVHQREQEEIIRKSLA